jgi:hypothetical protein
MWSGFTHVAVPVTVSSAVGQVTYTASFTDLTMTSFSTAGPSVTWVRGFSSVVDVDGCLERRNSWRRIEIVYPRMGYS